MQSDTEIYLFGGHELSREGLRHILNAHHFNVRSGAFESDAGQVDPTVACSSTRKVIVVDDAANQDALTSCRELKTDYPHARLVFLANDYDLNELASAFSCGVDGYIEKGVSCETLISSLKLIALGEKVLPSRLAHNLTGLTAPTISDEWSRSVQEAGLSAKEIEILGLLTVGLPNKVIARRIAISEATVKVHVKAIIRKLKVHNRTQAAIWAIKRGFEMALPQAQGSSSLSQRPAAATLETSAEDEHLLEAAE